MSHPRCLSQSRRRLVNALAPLPPVKPEVRRPPVVTDVGTAPETTRVVDCVAAVIT